MRLVVVPTVTVAVTVNVTVAVTVVMVVMAMVMVSVSMLLSLDNEMPAVFLQLVQIDIVIQRFLNGTSRPSHKHVVLVYILITR